MEVKTIKVEVKTIKELVAETARTTDLKETLERIKKLKAERPSLVNLEEWAARKLATEIWEEEAHEEAPDEDKPQEWEDLHNSLYALVENTSHPDDTGRKFEALTLGSQVYDYNAAEEAAIKVLQALKEHQKADQKISEFYEETKEAKAILEERIKQALDQEQSTPTEWARSHELSEEEREAIILWSEAAKEHKEAEEEVEETKKEEKEAEEYYQQSVYDYNEKAQDIVYEVCEENEPETAEREAPDTYAIEELQSAAEDLQESIDDWTEKRNDREEAEEREKEAQDNWNEAEQRLFIQATRETHERFPDLTPEETEESVRILKQRYKEEAEDLIEQQD